METEHSQSQQDAFDDQRILADAALIVGGARHRDGRLHITDDQLSSLQADMQRTTRPQSELISAQPVGETVLRLVSPYAEAEEAARKGVAEWENGIGNREKLGDAINGVTEPYFLMMNAMIPTRNQVQKNWLGRVRGNGERVDLVEREVDHTNFAYKVSTFYEKSENAVMLTGSQVTIAPLVKNREIKDLDESYINPYKTAGWELKTDGGQISSVSCWAYFDRYARRGPQTLQDRGVLRDVPEGLRHINSRGVRFALTGDSPSLVLGKFTYTYDKDADQFSVSSEEKIPEEVPKTISNSEYLQALRAVLAVYPAEATSL